MMAYGKKVIKSTILGLVFCCFLGNWLNLA